MRASFCVVALTTLLMLVPGLTDARGRTPGCSEGPWAGSNSDPDGAADRSNSR